MSTVTYSSVPASVSSSPFPRTPPVVLRAPPPSAEKIMQTGMAFWASKALLSAVELGVFTELAGHPRTLVELRESLGLHARSAHDFFDALVALGFLRRENGLYSNTPDADFFLDRRKPSYIGGLLEMANTRLYGFWGNLTEGLRTGDPQNEAKHGGDLFGQIYASPDKLRIFLEAMSGASRGANLAIAAKFPWHKYHTFVDVGTAQGDLAAQVALYNPHLHGLGFDLPQVGPIFQQYATRAGVAARVKFVGGDFFRQPLPKADVVLMGHILHDWDLPQKKKLIQAAWDALPTGGALIVYDAIIDDSRRNNAFGLLMSLNMLIETRGGFDYTGADCTGWMKEAGFRETYVQHLVGPDSMVVGIK